MLADASVLRAFAICERLDLLRVWKPLLTTRRVIVELERTANATIVGPVHGALADGWLALTRDRPDLAAVHRISFLGRDSLSTTDVELIALARALACPLLIHDRKATAVARIEGVDCRDLAVILEALKRLGSLRTREEMLALVFRLESFDGQTFPPPVRARLLRF